jgi:hypothetical protein
MATRLAARTQVVNVVTPGAAELSVTYTCPVGHSKVIVAAHAFHNDAVPRNVLWELDTGAGFGVTGSDLAQIEFGVAGGVLHHLYGVCIQPLGALGILLRGGQALRWSLEAKTAGTVLTMNLMVDEYVGETPYAH